MAVVRSGKKDSTVSLRVRDGACSQRPICAAFAAKRTLQLRLKLDGFSVKKAFTTLLVGSCDPAVIDAA